ncbi:hypothetical protein HHX47_DHR10000298 [Lentinula edodes]|nr:hypothetical protein HHX47_DHR10000298 [Lentinula edodes]
MYSKITSSPMKQKALDRTIDYVDIAGLDNAGAEGAEISGGFHSGDGGNPYATDTFSRLTALFRDKKGNQLYFYCSDGTFWDRVHIPEDDTSPEWKKFKYTRITHSEFVQKIKPAGA